MCSKESENETNDAKKENQGKNWGKERSRAEDEGKRAGKTKTDFARMPIFMSQIDSEKDKFFLLEF